MSPVQHGYLDEPLALVRSVAVAHGGYAMLENRTERGLRARIALPI